MKKIISILLALVMILGILAGCSSDEDKALDTIKTFISAVEKGNTKQYIECLDPDLQTIIESGTNSIGNALGISNAYGMSTAMSSLLNSALAENSGIKISFKQKEIKSSKIGEEKATFYIIYSISVTSEKLEEPVSDDTTLEFKLNKKDKKWYILTFNAVDDDVDTDILAAGYNIINATDFSDGVAFIQYKDENEKYKTVAIDTKGEMLYECSDDFSFDSTIGYSNGIMVIENLIYNKKGEVIASPEKTGYDSLLTGNINGLVLAEKTEESFEGDTRKFGVLNNKGEWQYPLSAENPIILYAKRKEMTAKDISVSNSPEDAVDSNIIEIGIGYTDEFYYDIKNNTCHDGYIHYESRYYEGEPHGIYQYTLDGGKKLVVPNVQGHPLYDEMFIGSPTTEYEDHYETDETKVYLYDYSGNKIIDLSKYKNLNATADDGIVNNKDEINYVKECLLVSVDNGTGGKYIALIKKDGSTAFEPIKVTSQDKCYPLDENGFVLEKYAEDGNHTFRLYSFAGKTTVYEDLASFNGFNDGLALVENRSGQYYYIDISGKKIII